MSSSQEVAHRQRDHEPSMRSTLSGWELAPLNAAIELIIEEEGLLQKPSLNEDGDIWRGFTSGPVLE